MKQIKIDRDLRLIMLQSLKQGYIEPDDAMKLHLATSPDRFMTKEEIKAEIDRIDAAME